MGNGPASGQFDDKLLFLAGGVVALMGLAWLFLASPWSAPVTSEDLPVEPPAIPPVVVREPFATAPVETSGAADQTQMAQMALEAGMLIEPREYSAWTLFGRIADRDPDLVEARAGLEQVASALLVRGRTALEQARYDDAAGIAATITERFPAHEGALELLDDIETATRPPEPVPPTPARVAAPVDPIPDLHAAFVDALARNAVLRPAGSSAIDTVEEMLATAPEHELTLEARELLATELLDRSTQSIEALDSQAARTWIDSAARIAADEQAILAAEARLTRHLIEQESEKRLPASELTAIETPAPEFPRIPLQRELEGWVELEFVVTETGTTENITVTDASHRDFFRAEAIAAVSQWRFAPSVFMGEPIPRRSYTRLAFVLD